METLFRAGSGNALLGFPEILKPTYTEILPEEMSLPLPQTLSGSIGTAALPKILHFARESNAVLVGPGMSLNAETQGLIWNIIFESKSNLIISGTAINALLAGIEVIRREGKNPLDFLNNRKNGELQTILVLETGEAIKLINLMDPEEKNLTPKQFKNQTNKYLGKLAKALRWLVVLIDNGAYVTQGSELIITPGDNFVSFKNILVGIIATFASQNPQNTLAATNTASYIFKQAIKLTENKVKNRNVASSDVIKNIGTAISDAEKEI
jgi:NAD(P)H-hydrate epimerase